MSCADHGADVVCDRCGTGTDGWGFPHRSYLALVSIVPGPGQQELKLEKRRQTAKRHCTDCECLITFDEACWEETRPSLKVGRVRLFPYCEPCWSQHVDDFDPGFYE